MRSVTFIGLSAAIALLAGCASMSDGNPGPGASLSGLRLEVPCANPKFNNDTECHWDQGLLQTADPAVETQARDRAHFRRRKGTVYEVTLHVRGVVEPKNFTGGSVQFDHFQTGGTPVKNDYNFYSLHVSGPRGDLHLQPQRREGGALRVSPSTIACDIPIRGGATVTMGAYDSNDVAIANHQHFVVNGVPPAPAPFDGQFFQLDVEAVTPRK